MTGEDEARISNEYQDDRNQIEPIHMVDFMDILSELRI